MNVIIPADQFDVPIIDLVRWLARRGYTLKPTHDGNCTVVPNNAPQLHSDQTDSRNADNHPSI